MKIIKRDGREVPFDRTKIEAALAASSTDVPEDALCRVELEQMAARVEKRCAAMERAVGVEEIQDMVIAELADNGRVRLALHYSDYRLRHEMLRKQNSTDKRILALLRHDSEVPGDPDHQRNEGGNGWQISEIQCLGKRPRRFLLQRRR